MNKENIKFYKITKKLLSPLFKFWFNPKIYGAENIPVSNDPTIANKTIPQTGTKASTTFISIALITCITLLGVVSYTEYKSIKIK